eukprot:CAMPEP_0171127198 /NCGR_PEP_ID=MMETSP0766_2-20121228/114830_1 /TAXON_ID=439317 /ORGANISM="Gambierdiscus australes, Strain CAWD 149" /LENGTH=112 /DNA_ID=CAMNT_0011590287 /DNA_START=6 /DNA_END=342 /DNA_ORIENTATION=-
MPQRESAKGSKHGDQSGVQKLTCGSCKGVHQAGREHRAWTTSELFAMSQGPATQKGGTKQLGENRCDGQAELTNSAESGEDGRHRPADSSCEAELASTLEHQDMRRDTPLPR